MLALSTYVMKGRFQAMTAAMVLALLSLLMPPFTILSAAVVALVTLRKGWKEGLFVIVGAGVAGVVLGELAAGVPTYAITYFLVQWLPILIASAVLRESGQQIMAISVLVFIGIAVTVLFYLFSDNPAEAWTAMIQSVFEPVMETSPELNRGVLLENLETASHYMTGIIVMSSLISLSLALFLGRWWQSNLYNPGGFRDEFLVLRVPKQLAWLTIIAVVMTALDSGFFSEMAGNIVLPLLVLFLIAGVSVLHCLLSLSKAKRFLLVGMYLMLFIIPHLLPPIAIVGFADTWFDIRKYIQAENNS